MNILPLFYTTLRNGLRVVVSPDQSSPVVTVGVYYKVGFRQDPFRQSGLAHLAEHLMFQGSKNVKKNQHAQLIFESGGISNASTRYDVTNYFAIVPSNALERCLWLEADRMRSLDLNEENLHMQREVVKEEFRSKVLSQPFGGFPWLDLPLLAFRSWPNAHNFCGDFVDLENLSLANVTAFFETYYRPNNSVLVIVGDIDPLKNLTLVERLFEDISPNFETPQRDASEPPQTEERFGEVCETISSSTGLAIGYHAPPRNSPDWLPMAVIDKALHSGRSGRIYRRIIAEDELAMMTVGRVHYPFGSALDYHGPTLMVTCLFLHADQSPDSTVQAYDDVVFDLQSKGIGEDELGQIKTKFLSNFYSIMEGGTQGPKFGMMHYIACFTLFDDNPGRINTIADDFCRISREEVRTAAQNQLVPQSRSIAARIPNQTQAHWRSLSASRTCEKFELSRSQ